MTEAYYPEVENKEISDLLKGKEGIIFYDENNNEIEIGSKAHFQYIKNMHEGISDEFAWEEVKLDVLNTVGNNLEANKIEVKKEIISETKQKIQEVKYDVKNSIKSNDIAGEYRPTAVEESYATQPENVEEIKPIEIQPENVEGVAENFDDGVIETNYKNSYITEGPYSHHSVSYTNSGGKIEEHSEMGTGSVVVGPKPGSVNLGGY